jgi:hypothetical protein
MTPPATDEEYAEQIRRCAQALSLGKNDEVAGVLAKGHTLDMLKMFTDGNLDKRYQKLVDECEPMRDAFDDLDGVIVDYVKTVPLVAYDTGGSDSANYLRYLGSRRPLTPEQEDFVAYQQGRYALESLALDRRPEHLRFQEMSALVESLAAEWGSNPDLWVHLNPLRVWATFQTSTLLDEDDETPATVLFYPVREDIRTAVLGEDGIAVVRFLESRGRARLGDPAWDETGLGREQRAEICRDLAEIGLAAFG